LRFEQRNHEHMLQQQLATRTLQSCHADMLCTCQQRDAVTVKWLK